MKKFLKHHRALSRLGCALLATLGLAGLGCYGASAFLLVAFQFMEFAMSKKCGVLFNTVLTPEQVKEFDNICRDIKDVTALFPALKDLAASEGGLAALKSIPALLKTEQKRNDELHGELKKLQKRAATFTGNTGVRWVGNVPFVTDDCARSLSAVLILQTNQLSGGLKSICRDETRHEGLVHRACEVLGMETRTAMTTTEIPVPTIYVPQIIELVFKYGAARQYATVFPLGAGTVKLPRLKAGEDDFAYLGAGAAGMSQSVAEKRVTAELVTFTANKAGGLIRIPTELEEDTFIPVGQFLARYISRQLAKLEDKTLFIGDGSATYASQTGVGPYCTTNSDYLLQLAAGKTKPSDVTLADLRSLRSKVSAAVLANMAANGQTSAAYYLHPSFESKLASFNTSATVIPYRPQQGGQPATLDGFPIRWIGVSQAYSEAAAAASYIAFFGDLSYWYLGERGSVRVEVSKEVFFATDEIALRALERIDVEALAVDAMAACKTAAS